MDSTKNFFDAWMNTQSKFVDNLMDTSKKIQESLNNGEVIEKSVELYNQWFDNQKSLTEAMMTTMDKEGGVEKNPAFFKNWMESQMQLGKKWMEYLNYAASKNGEDKGLEVYIINMQNLYEEWNRIYKQLFSGFQQSSVPMNFPGQFNYQSGFGSLINSNHTYMRMFELWQPIYKMMQSNAMGVDNLLKFIDIDKYNEVMNGIFHFMDKDKSQGFMGIMQQYNEMLMKSLNAPGMHQLEHLLSNTTSTDQGLQTLRQVTVQFSEQFEKFMNPYFASVPAGREKELIKLMIRVQNKYTKYYIRVMEMQGMVYASGQKAVERAVKDTMNKAQEQSNLISYDEFYTSWVNTMEDEMIALFGSDTYSKLQGDMLALGLEIKADLDKQMEHILANLPLVPRSEMDEVNATIHELKSKVRTLEKKLKTSLSE